jgi:glycosyltransferase involved in cell wall biosynthesis
VKRRAARGLKISYVYFHDTRFVPIHAYEIVCEMARRGWEVHVYTSMRDKEARRNVAKAGAKVHNILTIRARFISELLFMAVLLPYLFIQTFLGRPDIFYSRQSATSFMVALIGRFFGKRCVVEVNDIILDKLQFSKTSTLKSLWIRLYHYATFHVADLLLPVTEQIGSWMKEVYRLAPGKVAVVPNGVNPCRFSPKPYQEARRRYRIPLESRVVLSLGSLFPWVGMETLVAAAPQVLAVRPDTVFAIGSGEEPYLSRIKEAVSQANLTDVFLFYGFIPWDDASWFISTADICVAPFNFKSTRSGISSLRVFSYLACARPVIGSDIPGLGDLLEKQGMGRSFPMGDHNSLAMLLIDLLSSRATLKDMGEKGRKFVIDNHSWEGIVSALEARLQTCMARKKW